VTTQQPAARSGVQTALVQTAATSSAIRFFRAQQSLVGQGILIIELESFGSIPLCIDETLCISIMTVQHNSLPGINIYIYIWLWLQCFDPYLDHRQAYVINIESVVHVQVLHAKRDPVWFTALFVACKKKG
jgi:hypothetical protein